MPVIEIEKLCKRYRLGVHSYKTFHEDLSRWWSTFLGRPDPSRKVGREATTRRGGEYIWALRDVDLHVREGEVLGIIGRNGSGKSTLLKILNRITAPTAGLARMRGRASGILEVGTGFHLELTGRENVYLNGAILGMNKHEVDRKFDQIVAFSGVEEYIDTPVKRYSSGMSVRLAFAVAAHLEPEILLIDEVLAVGDAGFQQKCLGKIGDVAKGGRTVLFVSHDMLSIESLTDRCICLEDGRIVQEGAPDVVIKHYLNSVRGHASAISQMGRADLSGRYPARILKELTLRVDDSPAETVRMGDPITLEFLYEVEKPLRNLRLGIGINSVQGGRIVSFNSQYDSGEMFSLCGNGKLMCDMGRLPLVPGLYDVYVILQDGSSTYFEQYESAITFEVAPADIYDLDFSPRIQKGHFHWKANWSIEAGRHV